MQSIDGKIFYTSAVTFGRLEAVVSTAMDKKKRSEIIAKNQVKDLVELVSDFIGSLESLGLVISAISANRLLQSITAGECTYQKLTDSMAEIDLRVRDEWSATLFRIETNKAFYFFQSQPLFGVEVQKAFPSASWEIAEAGKCFATDRSTACVFHLMRALETPLKILAAKFDVSTEQPNWQNLLEQIAAHIKGIEKSPEKPPNWRDERDYFSQTIAGFMIIKDAWRNHTAHGRSKYTSEEALEIYTTVKTFMKKLSEKLHE